MHTANQKPYLRLYSGTDGFSIQFVPTSGRQVY